MWPLYLSPPKNSLQCLQRVVNSTDSFFSVDISIFFLSFPNREEVLNKVMPSIFVFSSSLNQITEVYWKNFYGLKKCDEEAKLHQIDF